MEPGGARLALAGLLLAVLMGAAPAQPSPPSPAPVLGFNMLAGDPIDLGTGLYVRSHDDIVQSGEPAIRFTRTYRNRDARSRAFGIGATHSYDLFLVGDGAAFSAIDLIRDDGGRIRFARTSPGTGLADAVLEHTSTPTEFYRAVLRWNGQGWSMDLRDGSRYRFLGCSGDVRPGQCGMIEYKDASGRMLSIVRDAVGNLVTVTNADGYHLVFTHDRHHRIIRARTGAGRVMTLVDYTYDPAGRLSRVRSYRADVMQTGLDAMRWLFGGVPGAQSGWSSETSEYTYDDSHQLVTIREPGLFIVNEYDSGGRTVRQTINDNLLYRFAYQVDDRRRIREAEVTEPEGDRYRVTFDSEGIPTSKVYDPGTPRETQIVYEREPGTNRPVAMSLRCGVADGSSATRVTLDSRESRELVEARLWQSCGLAGTPVPGR